MTRLKIRSIITKTQDCNELGNEHPIDLILTNAINNANDISDILNDIKYAISQLRRAEDALEKVDSETVPWRLELCKEQN